MNQHRLSMMDLMWSTMEMTKGQRTIMTAMAEVTSDNDAAARCPMLMKHGTSVKQIGVLKECRIVQVHEPKFGYNHDSLALTMRATVLFDNKFLENFRPKIGDGKMLFRPELRFEFDESTGLCLALVMSNVLDVFEFNPDR